MRRAARVDNSGVYLGSICRRGHDYEGTGKSLRHLSGHCAACVKEARIRLFSAYPEKAQREKDRQKASAKKHADSRRKRDQERKARLKNEIAARRRELYRLHHAENLASEAEKRDRNREKIREIQRKAKAKKRSTDIEAVRDYARIYYARNSLRVRLRNRISKALRQQKVEKLCAIEKYGIDLKAIAEHLGPCPGNLADWHIDHVRPLASFDLRDDEQLRQAFSPENHQWLTAKENMQKSAKYG